MCDLPCAVTAVSPPVGMPSLQQSGAYWHTHFLLVTQIVRAKLCN